MDIEHQYLNVGIDILEEIGPTGKIPGFCYGRRAIGSLVKNKCMELWSIPRKAHFAW